MNSGMQEYEMALRRFLVLFLMLFLIVVLGTLGYYLLEGWSLENAIYMTIFTLSAFGFKDVGTLSSSGKVLTTLLILVGLTLVGGWVAIVTSFLVSADLKNYFRRKIMIGKLKNMRHHTILCGGGSTGFAVIQELSEKKIDVVVIENNPEVIKLIEYKFPSVAVVDGNATSEEALWLANIKAAKNLITCLASDVDNLYVVITARDLNPNLFIVARAFYDSTAQRILKAGANDIVLPNKIGGQKMAEICYSKG